jgi:acyl-CoA synthetase (NDP forming)
VSLSGMRATMSHTGSLSTYGELYKALFKQFGVLQVTTLQEMIDVGNVLRLPRMQGKNIVVMTNSGGTAIISVDLLEREGFIVPALPEETRKQLSTFLPEIASKQNPLDLTVEGSKEAFANSLDVIYHTAKPDAFFFPYSSPDYHPVERLETLVDHIVQRVNLLNLDIPFVTCSLPSTAFFVKRRFESHGFPSFITESRGAYALKMLYQYSTQNLYPQPPLADIGRESLLPILTKAIQAKCGLLLDEDECRIILHRVGFRIPQYARCANLDECLAAAAHLKYPLVMKVSAPTISHKSDIGGIITGIASAQELERAFTTIMSNVKQYHPREEIAGVFLSEQISKGHELLLGIKRDPIFGSFIMLGLGGIFVEIFKDVALRLAPISAEEARSMIDELKAAPLLYGVRGQPGIDLDNLIVNLVNLSQLAAQCPEIQELDINPLIALPQGQGCHVADVRIVVGL